MIKFLMKNLGEYKKYAITAPFFVLIETMVSLLLPMLMSKVIDDAVVEGNSMLVLRYGGLMIVLAAVGVVCGIMGTRQATLASQGLGSNLRTSLFRHIQTFSFAEVDRFSTASLITRTTTDVSTLQQIFQMAMRILITAPLQLIISFVMVVFYSPKLAAVLFVSIPLLLVVVLTLMKFVYHLFQQMREKLDTLNATVQENLVGIRVVKSFVRENHERKKFKKANLELTLAGLKALSRMVLLMPAATIIINATVMTIYWIGGHMVADGALKSGSLIAIITYLSMIMMSIMMFSMIVIQLPRAQTSSGRIMEVLSTETAIQDAPIPQTPMKSQMGKVEFQDVSFKYNASGSGENVLSNINFTIEPGQTVAIVGDTGAGKSTLVNLIPRFYDVTEGAVLVNGLDVRAYEVDALRQHIGMVLQKNVLFSGTIRENMAWGNPDVTEEEMITALRHAQAYDFVMAFPEGLDYHIAQGGTNVSGGQRQRLCIARAIIKKPSILILDDSTSAVDSDTDAKIRKSFNEELHDCTVILIAQRISSVQDADKIIVLSEHGAIDGIGTHESLLKESVVYQGIYQTQQEGGLSDV